MNLMKCDFLVSKFAFKLGQLVCRYTAVMFSSGNGTEKARMGSVAAAGETVVDLFAGIGYYTLQLLHHAGVAKVYACEWNPNSVAALRANLVGLYKFDSS